MNGNFPGHTTFRIFKPKNHMNASPLSPPWRTTGQLTVYHPDVLLSGGSVSPSLDLLSASSAVSKVADSASAWRGTAANGTSDIGNPEVNTSLTDQEGLGARIVETEGNAATPGVLVPVAAAEVTAVEEPGWGTENQDLDFRRVRKSGETKLADHQKTSPNTHGSQKDFTNLKQY